MDGLRGILASLRESKMERPVCETCPFWYWDQYGETEVGDVDMAECRRYAPMADQEPNGTKRACARADGISYDSTTWPITGPIDWCGEHPDFPAYLESLKEGRIVPGSVPEVNIN